MGISVAAVKAILTEGSRRPFGGAVLTMGVQDIFLTEAALNEVLKPYGSYTVKNLEFSPKPKSAAVGFISDRCLLSTLGFSEILRLDASNYEGAEVIYDLNNVVDTLAATQDSIANFIGCFDVVIDAGTIEHVFNLPNALRNIFLLLKEGGRIIHNGAPSANHIDHGFYMFSPTLFFDYYTKNNFEINAFDIVKYWPETPEIWETIPYVPGSLTAYSLGGLDNACYAIHMVATKTATATGDVVPQQGLYSRRLWQPDHETLVAGDSDASPPHGDLSLHRFFRPLDRDASLDTVRGLLYRGEITKALAEADRALRGGSNIAELHFERAEAHRSLEHWGPAVADYSAAIALDEKNLTCYLRRATLLRQLGRYEEASRDREGALAMLSGSQREVLRGDLVFEDAMTALRSADPMERPKTETMPGRFGWLQKIRIRLRAQPAELQPTKEQPSPIEELERAHDIFRSTLADLPDDAGLLSRCIMVAMATHQTETAADYAERGLAQFPADLELIIQHASVMHALHRWDEALTSYDRALKQLPGREDLRAKRATALLHLSASKEGRFKPVPPSRWNARARRLLAEGDICAAAGNQARASCTFERALAEHLNDVDILMRCAVSAARLGNREASAQFADKAVALASGHPVIVYQHVSVMQALGIWDRALVDYNELIAVSPDRGDLYEGRAAVFDCLGQTAEAEADRGQSKALAATGEPG